MTSAKKIILAAILILSFSTFFTGCAKAEMVRAELLLPDEGLLLEEKDNLYFFDYEEISIKKSQSLDVKIMNTNLFLDDYGDLILYGEIQNNTKENITDIEVTVDIFDDSDNIIENRGVPIYAEYIQIGKKHPFIFHYDDKSRYIDFDTIRVGVNFKNYNNTFVSNPLVKEQKYYYLDERLVIEGQMVNIGKKTAEDLKVLATFYDKRDRVVLIRECYIPKNSLIPLARQDYLLELKLDDYIPEFTHYEIEVFFSDEI